MRIHVTENSLTNTKHQKEQNKRGQAMLHKQKESQKFDKKFSSKLDTVATLGALSFQ